MNIASYNKVCERELEADTKLIKRYWKLRICRFGLLADGGQFRVNLIITKMLQNMARSRQIRRDLAKSIQDPVRSHQIRRDFWQIVMRNHWFGQIQCLLCQKSTNLNEKKWPKSEKKMAEFWMDFGLGCVSRVLKLKTDNRPVGVGLVRSKPASDRRSHWIGWRRVGRFPWTPSKEF